ncbi:MAG: hypothetical protein H6835_04625 [Planctomycetes bacterium]|nr:hypothetical protein [Planctomycetota bacterium]
MTEAKVPRPGVLWRLLPAAFGTFTLLYVLRDRPQTPHPSRPYVPPPVETPFRITGKVVDDTGTPVSSALVMGENVDFTGLFRSAARELPLSLTDDDGSFVVYAPEAGTYELLAEVRGHEDSAPIHVQAKEGTTELPAPVQIGKALPTLSGLVVDQRGQPLPGIEISLSAASSTGSRIHSDDVTNAAGEFQLFASEHGDQRLRLHKRSLTIRGPVVPGPVTNVRVVVTDEQLAGGTLDVTVCDWRERPADGKAWVFHRWQVGNTSNTRGRGHLLTDGRVHITDLTIGEEVWVEYRGTAPAADSPLASQRSAPFVVAAHQEVKLELTPWARAPLLVVDADGNPVAGARVSVRDPDDKLPLDHLSHEQLVTDEHGKLTLWLPPGHVELTCFSRAGICPTFDATFEPGQNQEQVLRLTSR